MANQRSSISRTDLFAAIPFRAKFALLSAVFFIFAPLALLALSRFEDRRSWICMGAYFALGGFTAAGWAFAFLCSFRILWVLIPSQVLWGVLPFVFKEDFRTGFTLSVEGMVCNAMVVGGYLFFIRFIRGEGARTVRLQTEISLAQDIHAGLIPDVALKTARVEFFGKSVPSQEMGGDVLDVVQRDGCTVAYVADVSGHGVRAGVVMAMAKSAIRMKLRQADALDEVLNDLNAVLCELCSPGTFVTAACLRFDHDGQATFAGAGHGPVLHWRRSTGQVEQIESEHPPLGVAADEVYTARSIELDRGDALLVLTDGFTEIFDGDGHMLGQEPIEALFKEHGACPLPEVYSAIVQAAQRHGARTDDQTMLVARVV